MKPPKSIMDEYRPVIEGYLDADARSWRKQRRTAKRIYERLRDEHGCTASESTVRHYVARLRKEREPLSASFLTLVWAPGEAQADDSYRLWAQTETDVMDDILWVADLGFDQESQRFSQELSRDEEGFNAYLAALAERGLLENEYCGV